MYDLAVIGGGPVGSKLARMVSDRGHDVVLLEEHSEAGRPVQCAGLVSERLRELTPFGESCIINSVAGAIIMGPEHEELRLESPSKRVLVLDRRAFDMELWRMAEESGVEARTSSKVFGVREKTGACITEMSGEKIQSRYVAGCDGPASVVRRAMGIPRPASFLSGVGVEAECTHSMEEDLVKVRCGKKVAPGFFAWAIPLGEKRLRIGLALEPRMARGSPREYVQRVLRKPHILGLSGELRAKGWSAGTIPISPPFRSASHRMLLAGDAACQVKATSGGGIVMGLKGAAHASAAITEALESETGLVSYDRAWHRDMGHELRRDWTLHSCYSSLDDRRLSRVFKTLSSTRAIDTINRTGDIDYPSRLVIPLLMACPSLAALAFPFLGAYIASRQAPPHVLA